MNDTIPAAQEAGPGVGASQPSAIERCAPDRPISIYEVHLPSWMRVPEEQSRSLTYFEIAPKLSEYVQRLSFTHVQLFAPDHFDPKGFAFLTEHLHEHQIGVILDRGHQNHAPVTVPGQISADGQTVDGLTRISDCDYSWDMGWMEDTLAYFGTDPINRKFQQDRFRKRDSYAFNYNFILPLSRHLVTIPRPSLVTVMPGDLWQKFANLRLLFAYTFLLPGKKLFFMGNEFGQQNPWQPETSLDWHLVNGPGFHQQLMSWTAALNRFYRGEPALHLSDTLPSGFQWIDTSDAERSIVSFLRKSPDSDDILLVVLNFTPVPRHNYRIGVPREGIWTEKLNSDAVEYGGTGKGNLGGVEAAPFGWHFLSHSLILTLPPLGAVVLKSPSGRL